MDDDKDLEEDLGETLSGKPYAVVVDAVAVFGLVSNICLFVLMQSRELRCLSYSVYLRYLAVVDTLLLVANALMDTADHIYDNLQILMSQYFVCIVITTLAEAGRLLSAWLTVALTFDRFIAVVFPLKRADLCTVKFAGIAGAVIVVMGIALNFPAFVRLDERSREACSNDTKFYTYMVIVKFCFESLLPSVLILAMNLAVVVGIRKSIRFRRRMASEQQQRRQQQSDRAVISLLVISFVAFVCMVPKSIVEGIEVITYITTSDGIPNWVEFLSDVWYILNVMMLVNVSINFTILMLNKRLRGIFLSLSSGCRKGSAARAGTLQAAARKSSADPEVNTQSTKY